VKAALLGLIRRHHDDTYAARDVSFDVAEGEFVGFLGSNGAGKTTTLKMLAGLMHPTSGTATVLGYTPWERHHEYRRQFSFVMGQKNQLWWDLPAVDSLELNARIYGLSREVFRVRLDKLTSMLGVQKQLNVMVRELSLGERMKMELIAALLHDPKVLFLDEPTIGLDVVSQTVVRDFLREHNRQHRTTVLLTSHYMADIEALCDRVIIMDHGTVFFDGALAQMMQEFAAHRVLRCTCLPQPRVDEVPPEILALGEVELDATSHLRFRVRRENVANLCRALLDRYDIVDMSIEDVACEDVIRQLFLKGTHAKNLAPLALSPELVPG
jgi:ABC-2 type transport system ATP-binding protein